VFPADAQVWPERPVTILVGFAPGSNGDIMARAVAAPLSAALGHPVVVENRPGAAGNIAVEAVARGRPDGHTLVLITGGQAVSVALVRQLRFDLLNDLSFLSTISVFPFVVATRADGGFADLPAMLAAARARPGEITFSSTGIGSTQHLAGEWLAQLAGVRLSHVPYRGGGQPLADLLSGRIELMVDSLTVTGAAIRAGTVRALGVTSPQPWPLLPEAPTVATTLPGLDVVSWVGLAAPAGTPAPIIARLSEELRKALETPEMRERMVPLGAVPQWLPPDGMREMVAGQVARWRRVMAEAGIQQQ
jgi:tripartite-type tricarboxylate transporter receptor subunit TctC